MRNYKRKAGEYNLWQDTMQIGINMKLLRENYSQIINHRRKNTQKSLQLLRVNTKQKSNTKVILTIGLVFALLFAISYRNGLIAQRYSELRGLKSELTEIEKDNKQLEVNIEGKTNLSAIEAKASEELGMKKLDDSQTVYVSLDKQDYIESSAEEVNLNNNLNWFQKIINKVKNIF